MTQAEFEIIDSIASDMNSLILQSIPQLVLLHKVLALSGELKELIQPYRNRGLIVRFDRLNILDHFKYAEQQFLKIKEHNSYNSLSLKDGQLYKINNDANVLI